MGDQHYGVLLCPHVAENSRPILLVCKEGGDIQLLCGEAHEDHEKPKLAGLSHLLERDPTLRDVLDLPDDWEAERVSVDSPWVRSRCDY
jgi:hypothetical protein